MQDHRVLERGEKYIVFIKTHYDLICLIPSLMMQPLGRKIAFPLVNLILLRVFCFFLNRKALTPNWFFFSIQMNKHKQKDLFYGIIFTGERDFCLFCFGKRFCETDHHYSKLLLIVAAYFHEIIPEWNVVLFPWKNNCWNASFIPIDLKSSQKIIVLNLLQIRYIGVSYWHKQSQYSTTKKLTLGRSIQHSSTKKMKIVKLGKSRFYILSFSFFNFPMNYLIHYFCVFCV